MLSFEQMFYFGGVILHLDKYIFPCQMSVISGVHLQSELSCIQVNNGVFIHY